MPNQRTSLWRNRDYLFLVSGQAISSMGTEVSDLAYILLVLTLTGSPVLASLPIAFLIGHLTLVQIYITALLEPTFGVFFDLAERACLPQMVPREKLPAVSSQNQAIGYTAALLGPTLSGALYSVGRLFPFLVDAVSYVVSVISLFFIKTPFQEERRSAPQKLRLEISEGFLWLWQHPLLRFMTFLVGSLNLTVAGIYLVMVVLVSSS